MKALMVIKHVLSAAVVAAVVAASPLAGAQQGSGSPGMMGYGMGPGMMGGYGMGPGMIMGRGMMGGWRIGPDMMGSYGMGSGMMGMCGMGYGMLQQLQVTPDQRNRLAAIQDDAGRRGSELGARIRDGYFKLRDLMAVAPQDKSAVLAEYQKIQDIQLQSFQLHMEAHQKISDVLTPEQRQQLAQYGCW